MPTQNRSSNIEMVSVPTLLAADNDRDMLEYLAEAVETQTYGCDQCGHEEPLSTFDIASDLRDYMLAFPLAQAPHPHPDPIAWMVGTAFWWTNEEAERDAADTGLPIVGLGPMTGVAPTDQRQGEPAVLPMRKDPTESWEVPGGVSKAEGWNACLDEIAKLGPLYSRADTASLQRSWQAGYDTAWYAKNPAEKRTSVNPDDSAEVERLRDALRLAKHWCDAALNAIQMGSDNPGALNDVACLLRHMAKDLNSTAPASAEPSAPECGHAACKSLG